MGARTCPNSGSGGGARRSPPAFLNSCSASSRGRDGPSGHRIGSIPTVRKSYAPGGFRSRRDAARAPPRRSPDLRRSSGVRLRAPNSTHGVAGDRSVDAASRSESPDVNAQRHKLDQVGVMCRCIGIGRWQRLSFFQKQVGEVFHRTGNHQPGVRQIESLSNGPRKIQGLCHNEPAGLTGKMESHMVTQHVSIIMRRVRPTVLPTAPKSPKKCLPLLPPDVFSW